MDIPTSLKPLLVNLNPEDSTELMAIFSGFSAEDEELQRLLEDNLDALVDLLNTPQEPPIHHVR